MAWIFRRGEITKTEMTTWEFELPQRSDHPVTHSLRKEAVP
jgi:hypothetical protein